MQQKIPRGLQTELQSAAGKCKGLEMQLKTAVDRNASLTHDMCEAEQRMQNLEVAAVKSAKLSETVDALTAERTRNLAMIDDLEAQLEAAADISAEDHLRMEARLAAERDAALREGSERADALESNLVVVSSELEASKIKLADAEDRLLNAENRAELEKAEILRRVESLERELTISQSKAREMEAAARKSEDDARKAAAREYDATTELKAVTARLEVCEIDRSDLKDALLRSGLQTAVEDGGGPDSGFRSGDATVSGDSENANDVEAASSPDQK